MIFTAWDDTKSNSPPNNVIAAEEWNDMVTQLKAHNHNGINSPGVIFPQSANPAPTEGEVYYKPSDKSLRLYTGIWEKVVRESNLYILGRITGRYYTTTIQSDALTTGAPTANNLRAMPFFVHKKITVDRIAISVTTYVTGNARLGIYADNAGYPGSKIIDAGEVSTGLSNGIKEIMINQTLEQGIYWLAIVSSAAPTIRCLGVGNCIPTLGWDNTLGTAPAVGYVVGFTYAALPDPFPGGASYITAVPIPAIFLRMA